MVFYGTAKGEYFGDNGTQKSPIDVGNQTSISIEGLKNGTLYYFAVVAYDTQLAPEPSQLTLESGAFSREVAARPLRMAD